MQLMKHRYVWGGLLLLCAISMNAQQFTYVDWDVLRADSLPTRYTEAIPMPQATANASVQVSLLYPEYKELTAQEARQVSRWGSALPASPVVDTHMGVTRKQAMLDVSFIPIVRRQGKYFKLTSFKMSIKSDNEPETVANSDAARLRAAGAASRYTAQSVLSTGRWVKISIPADGVYRLSSSLLGKMGFNDLSRVKLYGYGGHVQSERIDADNDYDDLREIPLYKDNAGALFYGKGLVSWTSPNSQGVATHASNTYAREACYFVTEGDNPLAMAQGNTGVSASTAVNYTPAHVLYKKEEYAWYNSGRQFFESVSYASSRSKTYSLSAPDALPERGATLTVNFSSDGTQSCSVKVACNGEEEGSLSLSTNTSSYVAAVQSTRSFQVTLDGSQSNQSVALSTSAGINSRLGYLSLSYARSLVMNQSYIPIQHATATAANVVINTQGKNVKVWQIYTAQHDMCEMVGSQDGNTLTIPVSDLSQQYVAVDVNATFPEPSIVGGIDNQNLHALEAVDMIILVPASGLLTQQAERLAQAHRDIDGLRVQVVRADQVYNEFSSGTTDATAIRRFMKMLYDRAATDADMPSYLLLFGDGLWDNRMVSSGQTSRNPNDYLPCYESENSFSHIYSYVMEDYYGLLDDGEGRNLLSDKVDIGVGRFPVTTAAQAQIVVDKTIAYMQKENAGSWRNEICVLGDDGDNNQHLEMAESISQIVEDNYPEMQVNRIYWDAYKRESSTTSTTYPGVEEAIQKQMDNGCLMVNYTGHANPTSLSHELSVLLKDIASYKVNKLPLWVTAACDVAPFDMPISSLGKDAVLQPGGAAVAFLGTTRTVYATQNSLMNRLFTRYALSTTARQRVTIGDALRMAKVRLVSPISSSGTVVDTLDYTENKIHYVLLGDPALALAKPSHKLVVQQVNGVDVTQGDNSPVLKAGSLVRLKGCVQNSEEAVMNAFTGVLTANIYDSKSLITCLNNAGADEAFSFYTRDKKLFVGSDSIVNGYFDFQFPVPLDIKYSNESGRISLYAIDNARENEANGYNESIIVGGSGNDFATDTLGPSITAYLNDEGYQWGSRVNTTPYFVARLADASGINITGNAVGHDIELVIDGNPATTYVLNNYYQNDMGDYTSGVVAFSIPKLSAGQHTLLLRVWDSMNNVSVFQAEFEVDETLVPQLVDVTASANPAKQSTTFLVNYNKLPESTCRFKLEVFDFVGCLLWTHVEEGTSSTGVYPVQWNLTTSSGMPLGTGVYLYRVSVETDKSRAVSKTNKIIVLRQ